MTRLIIIIIYSSSAKKISFPPSLRFLGPETYLSNFQFVEIVVAADQKSAIANWSTIFDLGCLIIQNAFLKCWFRSIRNSLCYNLFRILLLDDVPLQL